MEINQKNLGGWAIGDNLFEWIINNVEKGSTIIELGSGTGSHELGKIYNIHCIEHDERWVNKFDNITYHYAPIENGWYDKEKLKNLPKEYSLLIIDGPPGSVGREKVLENLNLFKLDIPIVIDDTNRKSEKDIADNLIERLSKSHIVIKDSDNVSSYILI
jgi:hypothetical protein